VKNAPWELLSYHSPQVEKKRDNFRVRVRGSPVWRLWRKAMSPQQNCGLTTAGVRTLGRGNQTRHRKYRPNLGIRYRIPKFEFGMLLVPLPGAWCSSVDQPFSLKFPGRWLKAIGAPTVGHLARVLRLRCGFFPPCSSRRSAQEENIRNDKV
jgi:hypothetical protein